MSAATAPGAPAATARSLQFYVRGLLTGRGTVPSVRDAPPHTARPFADTRGLHLPTSFPMYGAALASQARLASAAHLTAHVRFGGGRFARRGLRPLQVVLVSLFEDARVEFLAGRELPGLSRLWASLHRATASDHATFPGLCARISRALLDSSYDDPHPLVQKARALFFRDDHDFETPAGCRRLGSLLGNDIGQTRLSFDGRTYQVEPPYRDDHRLLWEEEDHADQPAVEAEEAWEAIQTKARPRDSATGNGNDNPDDDDDDLRDPAADATAQPRLGSELAPAEPGAPGSLEQPVITVVTASPTVPEWDYLIGQARPDWCTLREQPLARLSKTSAHDPDAYARDGAVGDPSLTGAVERLARALKLEGLTRRRRSRDGDELDLDAVLDAEVERRSGRNPDLRVYTRLDRRRRDLSVLLLLDLSASTSSVVKTERHETDKSRTGGAIDPGEEEMTVVELAGRSALLLGDFLHRTGDSFAIHGFSSNGRHQVEYHRFKELDQPWNASARQTLHDLQARLSTRMGAAIRHAGRTLAPMRKDRRLILLLTDGEPADIDVPDPAYLLHDARHAVAEQRRRGVHVFAVSLDPAGQSYASRIFGAGGYWVVDRLDRLPRTLPHIYAQLAR